MNKSAHKRGFTLIELMIVVAIIGILAAVAIPKFAEMLRKSKEGATKGSLTALRSALTIYMSDNEGMTPIPYTTAAAAAVPGQVVAYGDQTTMWNCLVPLQGIMTPKYIETIPTAKLGTYHRDSFSAVLGSATNKDTLPLSDENGGWVYVSVGGGAFWVSCTHTDTKALGVTGW